MTISRWPNDPSRIREVQLHCYVFRRLRRIAGLPLLPLGLDNWPPPTWIRPEFRGIPATEFAPLGWIVAKPFS